MAKVVIIGAGGVGTVVAHKCAQHPEVFTEIVIASRTRSKCDAIVEAIGKPNVSSDVVDADSVPQLVELFNRHKPELVINVALPYQDLTIMDACLICGVNYLDTANYEPKDVAHFEYSWQWAYKQRFEDAGLTAILGCGFDPGVSGVFTAYAAKHYFSDMEYLDIVDCNGGDHGKAFATNFNPEINIREITQNGRYYEDGKLVTTGPLEIHKTLTYPNIGERPFNQARPFLDDIRTGISHTSPCNPEYRYGSHRRSGIQRTKDCSSPVPKGSPSQSAGSWRELPRRNIYRMPHRGARQRRQAPHLLYMEQLFT